jgi:hypothetical protein
MSSDIMNVAVLVGGILLVVFLTAAVLIVRGLRRGASGKGGDTSPAAPKGDGVHIITHGRDGEILYNEKGNICKFYWEFLGGDAIVGVTFPKKDKWDAAIPWAAGRQDEIMKKVAKEVVRQKAPGHKVRWADGSFDIL